MTKLSCNIVEDLLPLYHDGVCSEESRDAISEHLNTCPHCQSILLKMGDIKENMPYLDDAKNIKELSRKMKRKQLSIIMFSLFAFSFITSVGCFIAFQVKGSTVNADGMLVESFGFIPVAFFFAFIGFIALVILTVNEFTNHKK